jgi:hypothetical protein
MNSAIAIGITSVVVSLLAVAVSCIAVAATFRAPINALRVQREADEEREKRGRKLWIFKTLMGNRATRLNANFVQALNMIDIEFTDPTDKSVRDSWKELLDHYTTWGAKTEAQRKVDEERDVERSTDLLAEMLVKMGKELGYDFDRVYIKKGFYYPEGLGNLEAEQHALRRSVLALLSGSGMKLPVAVFTQDFQPLNPNLHADGPPAGLEPPPLQRRSPAKSGNGSRSDESL